MDKSGLVKLLSELNANFEDQDETHEKIFQKRYDEISKLFACSFDDILKKTVSISNLLENIYFNYELKYICLNFYILELLNEKLSKSEIEVLSVQEIKNVKDSLKNLTVNCILKNIQPNLPRYVPSKEASDDENIFSTYTALKITVFGLYTYMKVPNLRLLILPHCLQAMLMATFQLAYCPLKKPTDEKNHARFVMSDETYKKLLHDQSIFKKTLDDMSQNIHPSIFIKETMVLFQANAPLWFKKSISNVLTKMIRGKKGVQHVALAMLEGSDDDVTKSWKILDVLTKLILSCRKFEDFDSNICRQVLDLLSLVKETDLLIFERLVVSCIKSLYCEDAELCRAVFLSAIMAPLLHLVRKEQRFGEGSDITDDIKQTVRLLYGCFADSDSFSSPCLPINLLKEIINAIFIFYHLTVKSTFLTTNNELKEILIKYLQSCTRLETHELLDNFVFGFTVRDIPRLRDDVIIEVDKKICVKHSLHAIIYATADVIDTVFNLLDTDRKIILFGYLLRCLTDKEKYFPTSHNSKELLAVEETSTVLGRLLATHKLLAQLAEDKDVQKSLKNKPDEIIHYIDNSLNSKNDQTTFTILMILDTLVENSSTIALSKYKVLLNSIHGIRGNTTDIEIKTLCAKIVTTLSQNSAEKTDKKEITEFDRALEDAYDPLLPVRGHGLLTLSKLLEKKDKKTIERKQYLLNLFQLYLKDDDSFIYLNAVQGLAALADLFPDTVIETLCEEFADCRKQSETRLKLGEVLVRVVKMLGEMAPKYKAPLLNTLLSATKDDDHLIRASSLSNLGEVCRVLNYKLGSIVTEVLVCVHGIVTTDKAVEARRAAVTVIRQLFIGLGGETIAFLREEILPVYRSLKEIYYRDEDDVMRLQAQLALEELNENIKSVVFPKPELNLEKKIVMLD